MSWASGTVKVKTAADLFQPASQVAQHKKGLKLLIYGPPETMKTGFGLSCPDPLVDFDTELGSPPLFRHFIYCPACKTFTKHDEVHWAPVEIEDFDYVQKDGALTKVPRKAKLNAWISYTCRTCGDKGGHMKEILWCDATFLNPETGVHDSSAALQSLQSAIALLSTVNAKTIVIDSGTDVWDWIQEWLDEVGTKIKGEQLMRTEWHKARLKWKKLLLEMFARDCHFIMTAQTQDVYDKGTKQPTGEVIPRVEKTTTHAFDLVIKMKKYEIPQPDGTKKVEYHSDIVKCRFQKDWRPKLPQELTFDKLVEVIQKDLGIEVF